MYVYVCMYGKELRPSKFFFLPEIDITYSPSQSPRRRPSSRLHWQGTRIQSAKDAIEPSPRTFWTSLWGCIRFWTSYILVNFPEILVFSQMDISSRYLKYSIFKAKKTVQDRLMVRRVQYHLSTKIIKS